jgi:RNA polymerase sigma factor (sigma-70 family)
MTPSDQELLQRFARDRAQDAFTELVKRHVNLVYSAALRQVRSPQLAEEVAQSVFADLARVADKLGSGTGDSPVESLTPWLFAVTRRTAVDVIRKESRRQLREQIAVEMNQMNAPNQLPHFAKCGTESAWPDIEPLLDEAVAALDEPDRAAVLLRYFENQSLRAVGQQLGVSDDAAQKRVSRAVERLREFFAKRGVTVSAGGLVVVISANAVQAAPVGLAVTISAAALAGTAATTSTLIAATTKTIAMTTLQKTLVTATVAVLVGAGIYEARQAAHLRDQVQTLQQQQAPLAEHFQQLQNNFADATNRLADLTEELAKASKNNSELLRLRGEVGLLRRQLEGAKVSLAQANQPESFDKSEDAAQQQERMRAGTMLDARILSSQLAIIAYDNGGWFPTNWSQVVTGDEIFPITGKKNFEFVHEQPININPLGSHNSDMVVIRERAARQSGDGYWHRVYGFADGHSQEIELPNGNFTAWEEQNTYRPEASSQ